MTWQGEVDAYIEWLATRHEKNEGKAVSANYLRYSEYLLKHFGNDLHPASFKEITKDDVITWTSNLRKRGLSGKKGVSEASVRGYMAMVKAFLRHLNGGETPACLQGLSFGGFKSRVESYDDLADDDELEKALSVLALPGRTVVLLIRHSGARPGEVLGTRRRNAKIVTRKGREFVILSFPKTKTGQPRSAVVSDPTTIDTLKEYLAYAPESEWLFPAVRNDGPMPYQTLWRSLQRACEKAGVRHIYPYQLRHTWASKEGAKMPSHIRSRQMGTKSETIMNHYDHVGAEGLLEAHLEVGGGRPVVDEGKVVEFGKLFRGLMEPILERNLLLEESVLKLLPEDERDAFMTGGRKTLEKIKRQLEKIESMGGV